MSWSCLYNQANKNDGQRRIALFNAGLLVWLNAQAKNGGNDISGLTLNRNGESLHVTPAEQRQWEAALGGWISGRGEDLMASLTPQTTIKLMLNPKAKVELKDLDPGCILHLLKKMSENGSLSLNAVDSELRKMGVETNSHQIKDIVDEWKNSKHLANDERLNNMDFVMDPPRSRIAPPKFDDQLSQKQRITNARRQP